MSINSSLERATEPVIQKVFNVIIGLFSNISEATLQQSLGDAVDAFEGTKDLKYGKEIWQVYDELSRLARMRNIDEIARYRNAIDTTTSEDWELFDDSLQIFRRLDRVTTALSTYLKREGLGDRLASLLEANTVLDAVSADVQGPLLSDRVIFALLLTHWRALVAAELSRLVGKAELRPELRTKSLLYEESVSVWLNIHNDGDSPADDIMVTLLPCSDYALLSANDASLETISSGKSARVKFTIKAHHKTPHLTFELHYSDAGSRSMTLSFGDWLELSETKRTFQDIPNPYSVGMPIRNSEMFYGRHEDLQFLKTKLTNTKTNVTVVLYGQRRSGKTSLLNQLVNTTYLEPHIPVFIDMQNETMDINVSKFLRNIAHAIQQELKKGGISVLPPGLKEFDEDPTFVFNQFLNAVEEHLHRRRLIILIDEFEILENKVKEGALPKDIFEYLRSLMQRRQGMSFLFAGTHSLKELATDYWSVFFNIATPHRLTLKLDAEDARKLIVEPVNTFLEYDDFAIQKIQQLTADQPYLIQLVCSALVDHCNTVEKSYVTINDVNTVLPDVMETGEGHFKWIWDQADQQERIVLSILAQAGGDESSLLSLHDIEQVYHDHGLPFNHVEVLQALQRLTGKDIVKCSVDNTCFRIFLGLLQKWLRDAKALRRVMLEENLLAY